MNQVVWPKPNPTADRLVARLLDRVSPGWGVRMGEANVPAVEVMDLLWAWNPLFQGAPDPDNRSEHISEADDALERLAQGEPAVFSRLSAGALGVLKARHSIAVASATYRVVDGDRDPVMRLPHGLTPDERRLAVTVRLLFQADTAI